MSPSLPTIAIIGAGLSGLTCGRILKERGYSVTLFDKGRGVAGRMSTRRIDHSIAFDHGAQYFTARDERFQTAVETWKSEGIVQPWNGRIVDLEHGTANDKQDQPERLVAVPAMNSLCKHLAENLDVRLAHEVVRLKREGAWHLELVDGSSYGPFDKLICTAPAPQTADLVSGLSQLEQTCRAVNMKSCWALMLAFRESLNQQFAGAFVVDSPLSWIANSSSKPGRDTQFECWVAHGSAAWSDQHLESTPAEVQRQLLTAFDSALGGLPTAPASATVHRWRYALAENPLEQQSLWDHETQLGICGDWAAGQRVEGAYLSGRSMAETILALDET